MLSLFEGGEKRHLSHASTGAVDQAYESRAFRPSPPNGHAPIGAIAKRDAGVAS
jgi:hypothetical protein